MYSTVSKDSDLLECTVLSVRRGISWCAQYCVSKDSDLLECTVLSVRRGISWCAQYCVSKDRGLLFYRFCCFPIVSDVFYFRMQKVCGVAPQSLGQVHASFRRYMYDHQVEEAECPLCGANDQCASPTTCPTRSRHRARQRHCQSCHMWLHYDCESLKQKNQKKYTSVEL